MFYFTQFYFILYYFILILFHTMFNKPTVGHESWLRNTLTSIAFFTTKFRPVIL